MGVNTMARYIDAEKMRSLLEEEIEGCGNPTADDNPIAYGTTLGLKMALSYAKTLPTAEPYQYKPKVCVEDEEE